MKVKANIEIEINAHIDDHQIKTHDCKVNGWWGNDVCELISIDEKMKEVDIPKGDYKIKIILIKE